MQGERAHNEETMPGSATSHNAASHARAREPMTSPSPKEHPMLFSGAMVRAILNGSKSQTRRIARPGGEHCPLTAKDARIRPGDRIWVRETWCEPEPGVEPRVVLYRADMTDEQLVEERELKRSGVKSDAPWIPSIFMQRWASRITLEITEVRVQRLQEISEEDARAEGVQPLQMDAGSYCPRFEGLWNGINGERPGCAWADNPWVWAFTFRRLP